MSNIAYWSNITSLLVSAGYMTCLGRVASIGPVANYMSTSLNIGEGCLTPLLATAPFVHTQYERCSHIDSGPISVLPRPFGLPVKNP